MKKNLLALLVLLVLVAVTAQFTRQGGKKPEWVAFERDLQTSLELLWEQPGQSAELRPAEGGVQAVVGVRMPANSFGGWNYDLVRFVAERHPGVNLQYVIVSDAATMMPLGPPLEAAAAERHRSELLRRQAQANLGGRGLLLVDFRQEFAAPAKPHLELNIPREVEAAPYRSRGPSSGKVYIQATPTPVPQIQIHACLVVFPEVSPEEVDQAVKSLNLNPERGDQIRVVKLPPL